MRNEDWDDEVPSDEELEAALAEGDGLPEEGPGSLASVGARALGRFIDVFLVFNVAGVLSLVIVNPSDDPGFGTTLFLATIFFAIAGIYETAMVAWRGQTLGKLLMGTRIVRRSDGDTPIVTEAAVRFAVPTLPLYVPYIGQFVWVGVYLSAIPNARKQGFHDKAAGTLVVRTR